MYVHPAAARYAITWQDTGKTPGVCTTYPAVRPPINRRMRCDSCRHMLSQTSPPASRVNSSYYVCVPAPILNLEYRGVSFPLSPSPYRDARNLSTAAPYTKSNTKYAPIHLTEQKHRQAQETPCQKKNTACPAPQKRPENADKKTRQKKRQKAEFTHNSKKSQVVTHHEKTDIVPPIPPTQDHSTQN